MLFSHRSACFFVQSSLIVRLDSGQVVRCWPSQTCHHGRERTSVQHSSTQILATRDGPIHGHLPNLPCHVPPSCGLPTTGCSLSLSLELNSTELSLMASDERHRSELRLPYQSNQRSLHDAQTTVVNVSCTCDRVRCTLHIIL